MSFANNIGEVLRVLKAGKHMVIFVVCRTHFGFRGENRLEVHGCGWQNFPSRPEPRRVTERRGRESNQEW